MFHSWRRRKTPFTIVLASPKGHLSIGLLGHPTVITWASERESVYGEHFSLVCSIITAHVVRPFQLHPIGNVRIASF